jgi:hypothetical protein
VNDGSQRGALSGSSDSHDFFKNVHGSLFGRQVASPFNLRRSTGRLFYDIREDVADKQKDSERTGVSGSGHDC